ncbi:MAG: hypothetical protein V3U02_05115 [Calditrichia bacterium]
MMQNILISWSIAAEIIGVDKRTMSRLIINGMIRTKSLRGIRRLLLLSDIVKISKGIKCKEVEKGFIKLVIALNGPIWLNMNLCEHKNIKTKEIDENK